MISNNRDIPPLGIMIRGWMNWLLKSKTFMAKLKKHLGTVIPTDNVYINDHFKCLYKVKKPAAHRMDVNPESPLHLVPTPCMDVIIAALWLP